LGLRRLGVQSFWVDHLSAIDPIVHRRSLNYLVERFRRMACDFGFGDSFCIIYNDGERYFGLSEQELLAVIRDAELYISVSGHLPEGSPLMAIPRRAYMDVDPGFRQIWALDSDVHLERHNFFFTVGQNVGGPDFTIPTRIAWEPILPPVVLEQWPAVIDPRCECFSTVADWRGSQHALYDGQYYAGKRSEFVKYLRLPRDSGQKMELALCIGPADFEDLGLLDHNRWSVVDPYLYAGDPWAYREYIQSSRAEFSVAKNGYVRSNSGWISDRTACYLASGKPALVQSTGFEHCLPTGRGLLTFRTLEEAIAGVRSINEDYLGHCQAARRLAEQCFNSDVVLGRILERVGL
jgi:hypothetical protein